jgi:type VI secretion system protein ImpC
MADALSDAQAPALATSDGFAELLRKEFKPKTDRARSEVERAVQTLAEQALRETTVVSDDVVATIKALIAEIDTKLSAQINVILHNERFQQVESAWRGLHYLVHNTETDEMLKVRVMNVSKSELSKSLRKYKGAVWDQSPLFKKIYEQEYG